MPVFIYERYCMTSRSNAGIGDQPFGSAPIDANRKELPYATSVLAEDATATPVTSPLTGTSPIVLNIPENAVEVTFMHDATTGAATMTFNGQAGTFGLVANQFVTLPCAGVNFKTITVTPGSGVSVYFAFSLV